MSVGILATPVAGVMVAASRSHDLPTIVVVVVAVLIGFAVLVAVHHGELVAHCVGGLLGLLLPAAFFALVEVGLVVTLMIAGGTEATSLARDTIYAAVMVTCNGMLGLSLVVGSARPRPHVTDPERTGGVLATVAALIVTCLVLPTFATDRSVQEFSPTGLGFAAVASVAFFTAHVSARADHGGYRFSTDASAAALFKGTGDGGQVDRSTQPASVASVVMYLVALTSVVSLATLLSPAVERAAASGGISYPALGVIVALFVLFPRILAAAGAARRGRFQVGLDLALDSAMASIALTIPVVAIVAGLLLPRPLLLGLDSSQIVLFALTVIVASITVIRGRVSRSLGIVHLLIFASFLLLAATS